MEAQKNTSEQGCIPSFVIVGDGLGEVLNHERGKIYGYFPLYAVNN